MSCLRMNVSDFRSKRKCSTITGSWVLMLGAMLLLVLPYASSRSSDETFDGFNAEEYTDVDNVEWHHVKIVDGVMQPEDHPVIFYKEDFVSEDYDPAKEKRKNSTSRVSPAAHRSRKYKEISRRHRYNQTESEKYHAIKPEKMYFDVLPQAPVVVVDDSSANDSKFDASKIRVEVMSLADETTETNGGDETESKQQLNKRPKKYKRRLRRDTTHSVQKRTPYYGQGDSNSLINYAQTIISALRPQLSHPVRGNYYNPVSLPGPKIQKPSPSFDIENRFGDENETDRVIWSFNAPASRTPVPTRRVPPPLFRDPNPANADSAIPTTTRRPTPAPTRRVPPPLIRQPVTGNAGASFTTTRRPLTTRAPAQELDTSMFSTQGFSQPANISPPAPTNAPSVSDCIWAIVQCCSPANRNIRYSCFESLGCRGAFWDLNPCAEDIQDNALNYVSDFLN